MTPNCTKDRVHNRHRNEMWRQDSFNRLLREVQGRQAEGSAALHKMRPENPSQPKGSRSGIRGTIRPSPRAIHKWDGTRMMHFMDLWLCLDLNGQPPPERNLAEPTAMAALFLNKTPEGAIKFLEADIPREHTTQERMDIREAIQGIKDGIYKP